MKRYAMLIDLSLCVGCEACTVACKLDNKTGPSVKWGRIVEEEAGVFPDVKKIFVPLLCMHCENPACVEVCPTGASYQRPDGIVLVDPAKCMGCKFCIIACPYKERYLNAMGFVEKCDLCIDRLGEGRQPVCVETCPYGARVLGDLNNPNDEVTETLKHEKTIVLKAGEVYRPRVHYKVTE